jgi:hypothetical protein
MIFFRYALGVLVSGLPTKWRFFRSQLPGVGWFGSHRHAEIPLLFISPILLLERAQKNIFNRHYL